MKEVTGKVQNWIQDLLIKASERLQNENILSVDPDIDWSLKGKCAGQACAKRNDPKGKIRLNAQLIEKCTEDQMKNTVGHELAHLICSFIYPGVKPHGMEWKKVMMAMGLEPSRCHSYNFAPAKKTKRFKYICKKCGHVHPLTTYKHNKMKINPHHYICKCNGFMEYKGEVI